MRVDELISELEKMNVRFYGKRIVSPFKMMDQPSKDARINFLIEKCGFVLVDGTGYPPKPSKEKQEATA